MVDTQSIFGDFSNQALRKGLFSLITQQILSLLHYHQIAKNENFHKFVNINGNPNILYKLPISIFGDFSKKNLVKGIDTALDMILREYLVFYPQFAPLDVMIFGDFSEDEIINNIKKIINDRISESFKEVEQKQKFEKSKNNSNQSFKSYQKANQDRQKGENNGHRNFENDTEQYINREDVNKKSQMRGNANQYVYLLYNEILYQEYKTHIYKIGWTSRNPKIRADEISQGTGVIGKWKVAHQWQVEDGYWLEQKIFNHFSKYRLNKSEQFNFKGYAVEQVAQMISDFIKINGESPKIAEEIALKNYQIEKEKLEKERLYQEKCDEMKKEIESIQTLRLEKILKNDPQLKKAFYESIVSWILLSLIISIFIPDYIILLIIVGGAIGYIGYCQEKDSKYKELKKTHVFTLPNDLEKLRKIRSNL